MFNIKGINCPINFINPNILSCLFIEKEASRAVYSACYQVMNESKDSLNGMHVILSLSTALEIELKSTLFNNFRKEISEYFDFNKNDTWKHDVFNFF